MNRIPPPHRAHVRQASISQPFEAPKDNESKKVNKEPPSTKPIQHFKATIPATELSSHIVKAEYLKRAEQLKKNTLPENISSNFSHLNSFFLKSIFHNDPGTALTLLKLNPELASLKLEHNSNILHFAIKHDSHNALIALLRDFRVAPLFFRSNDNGNIQGVFFLEKSRLPLLCEKTTMKPQAVILTISTQRKPKHRRKNTSMKLLLQNVFWSSRKHLNLFNACHW